MNAQPGLYGKGFLASGFFCEQNKMSTCLAPMASSDAELECHTVSLQAATLPHTWPVISEVEPGTQLTASSCGSSFTYKQTQIDCKSRITQAQSVVNAQ